MKVLDLYGIGFRPWMTGAEHRDYETIADDHSDPMVTEHIALVRWAEGLVFVYPTWWASLPAMLKGWLDRVLLPGVAFSLNPQTRKVEPGLRQVKKLVGITTYGAPRWQVALLGDGGRTIIGRTLRLMCRRPSRLTWLWLDRLDGRTEAERKNFIQKVEQRLARM